jgi:hypothetical protein
LFGQYFSNKQGAELAIWLLANDEMAVDTVVRFISSFKNANKKNEFQSRAFDYTHYRLRNVDANPDEAREMDERPDNGLISKFKEDFAGKLD